MLVIFFSCIAVSCSAEKGNANSAVADSEETEKIRPNILFIMSDDHAERAISAYNSELTQTPNIDRIAKEGIRFDNAFVTNSICGPSRAVMLTGLHSHLNGFRDNSPNTVFNSDLMTFPKLLQQSGYETSVFGKWHLGSEPTGFDYWQVLIDQGEYYSPQFKTSEGVVQYDGAYVSEKITDLVLEQLENHDKSKPFAILYHHKAPHRNWIADVKLLALGKLRREFPIPDSFYDDYSGRIAAAHQDMRIADMYLGWDMKLQPDEYEKETGTGGYKREAVFDPSKAEKRWAHHYNRMNDEQKAIWHEYYANLKEQYHARKDNPKALAEWMYQRYLHDYIATVQSIDDNVGRVLDYLDDYGLAENTLVVYTSDQGFYLGEHGWFDKRFMYEESMSTPLLMRYPAMIKPGQVSKSLVQNLDFASTFLDVAGISIPSEMHGASMKPLLQGKPVDWRKSLYYQYFEYPVPHAVMAHYGIRTNRYKLIYFENEGGFWELYDLEKDPGELNNIYDAKEYKSIQMSLHQQLVELREHYDADVDEDR